MVKRMGKILPVVELNLKYDIKQKVEEDLRWERNELKSQKMTKGKKR